MQFTLGQVYLILDINYQQVLQISNQLEHGNGRDLLVGRLNAKIAKAKPPVLVKRRM